MNKLYFLIQRFKYWHLLTGVTMSIFVAQNCAPTKMSSMDSSNLASSQDTPAFMAAKSVLAAKCLNCHSASGSAAFSSFDLTSAQSFVSQGLVSPGKPEESKLIFRLKATWTSNHDPVVQNMPLLSSISVNEYNVLRNWVLSMANGLGPYTCNENAPIDKKLVATAPKLLSPLQYRNTLSDFLNSVVGNAAATTIYNKAMTGIVFPEVSVEEKYPRKENNLNEAHLKIFFSVADATAKELVGTTYYANFVTNVINADKGFCTTINVTALSTVCQTQFVRNLGLRLLRRPLRENLGDNETGVLTEEFTLFAKQSDAVSTIVFRLMLSTHFLYLFENNETELTDNANVLRLSSYAIASRLSYQFWNSMPDDALFAKAKAKDLYQEADFLDALDHVLKDAKAKSFIDEFTAGWLSLNRLPALSNTESAMQLPALNLRAVRYDSALRTQMIQEIQELVSHTWRSDGVVEDILTSNISFARNAELMKIYNVATPAPATITSTNAVRLPSSHAGILTRAGLLVEANGIQNPVHRAIRIIRDVACITLPEAPADTMPEIPLTAAAIETMTVRKQFEHNTSTTTCFECHKTINPFGFALSNFNGLGYFQTQEPAMNALGTPTGAQLTIDSRVSFDTTFGPAVKANSAVDYSSLLSKRAEYKSCFIANYSDYFLNRAANEAEGCRLNKAYLKLQNRQPLGEVFRSLALDPEFRLRKLENK
jgi:hypothetical protein